MTVGGLTNFGTIQNYGTEPYCSVGSFRAAPTWLDSNDLIPGGVQSKQDAELYNVLNRASTWADGYCGGATEYPYLGASSMTQNFRTRADRFGELKFHVAKRPVQVVTAINTGYDPLTLVPIPNITQIWIEDNSQVVVPVSGSASFVGLQFGPAVSASGPTYVQLQYVAGYFNSTLTAGTYGAGTTSVSVINPIGLIPGTMFRINDPGQEEVVTVASNYTQGSSTVPLVNGLLYTHTAPAQTAPGTVIGASALPMDIQQATICYAVGLLMREDTSSQQPFAGTSVGPSTRKAKSGGKSAGLISDAEGYLSSFRRVR
jgi:hypothetical protein